MSTSDKIAGSVFLVVGALLIISAFHLEFWLRHISLSTLFMTLSVLLLAVGTWHFVTARGRADRVSQQLAGASPLRRLWLPARYYSATNLHWQFRLMSIMMLAAGLMTIFVAVLAYRRGL